MPNKKELPNNWCWSTIGEICKHPQYGWTTKASSSGSVKLLRTTDITSGVIDWDTLPFCDEIPSDLEKYLLQDGDIVVSRAGSVGVSHLVFNPEKSVFASYLIRFNPFINRKYVYYFLQSPDYWASISEKSSGIAVQNVNASKLKDFEIPIAPLKVQDKVVQKIEELFSHIDAGVEGLKQTKTKLQQYRQSVLKDAVTGKLTEKWRAQNTDKLEPAEQLLERILTERRANWEQEQLKAFAKKDSFPKDDKWQDRYPEPSQPELSDVPEIPCDWIYLRLDDIANIQGGITVDAKRSAEKTSLLPYLRVANVQRGYFDLSEIKEIRVPNNKIDELLLQEGDILFNEGGDRDKLGRGWVWHNEVERCIFQNHVFRARLFVKGVIPEFVSYYGNTIGKDYFIKQGKQTTNLASINKTKLSAFPIPICSASEMFEIVSMVSDRMSKVDRVLRDLDEQLKRASRLKSSVLEKAFSGRLVENNETVESALELLERIQEEKQLITAKRELVKLKPKARAKKMEKRPVFDVIREAGQALKVEEIFELAGFQNDVSPEGIEAFYQELKEVSARAEIKVTPFFLDKKKQGDKFEYKEVGE